MTRYFYDSQNDTLLKVKYDYDPASDGHALTEIDEAEYKRILRARPHAQDAPPPASADDYGAQAPTYRKRDDGPWVKGYRPARTVLERKP